MDMNTMTLPRKGLKTRHHNKDMNERGLKKCDYMKYMDMEKGKPAKMTYSKPKTRVLESSK